MSQTHSNNDNICGHKMLWQFPVQKEIDLRTKKNIWLQNNNWLKHVYLIWENWFEMKKVNIFFLNWSQVQVHKFKWSKMILLYGTMDFNQMLFWVRVLSGRLRIFSINFMIFSFFSAANIQKPYITQKICSFYFQHRCLKYGVGNSFLYWITDPTFWYRASPGRY